VFNLCFIRENLWLKMISSIVNSKTGLRQKIRKGVSPKYSAAA
jgi:hypothetical protein